MTTVVLLLRFATHLYLARRVRPLLRAPWGARAANTIMALVVVLPLVEWAVSVWLPAWGSWGTLTIQLEGFVFLVGWALLSSTEAVRRIRAFFRPHAEAPSEPDNARRREVTGGLAVAVSYGVPAAFFGYGSVVGRVDYQLEEVVVRIAGLPKELDGYTLVQLSDVHVGPLVGPRELARGLEVLRRAKADLVLVTGDVVDHDPQYADMFARLLTDCPARDGHVAVMGNHDHYAGAHDVRERLARGGVTVLNNQHLLLHKEARGGLAILGLDDPMGGAFGDGPDVRRALAGLLPEVPRVMLQHRPDLFDRLHMHAALQLSGHTHGGQVSFGAFNPADLLFRYVRGRYERGDSTLYVNRGFGVVGVPARIDSPPEITKIVLVSA